MQPRPKGLGLEASMRNHQAMLLASKGMHLIEKVAIANGIYALTRTMQTILYKGCHLNPSKLFRLYSREAMRGTKGKRLLCNS